MLSPDGDWLVKRAAFTGMRGKRGERDIAASGQVEEKLVLVKICVGDKRLKMLIYRVGGG